MYARVRDKRQGRMDRYLLLRQKRILLAALSLRPSLARCEHTPVIYWPR